MSPRSGVARWIPGRTRIGVTVVALLLTATVMLTGCSVVSSLVDTQQGLRDAGYQSVSVHYKFGSGAGQVQVHVAVAAVPTRGDVHSVASLVWRRLHQRFDTLDVSVRGTGSGAGQVASQRYTFAEMRAAFGARNPSWDKSTINQSATHLGLAILAGIVLVVVTIAVVAVVMTRRNRRRRPWGGGGAPTWPPPPGPPGAWGPGPPPPPGPPGAWGPGPPPQPPGRPWAPSGPPPPAQPGPPGEPPRGGDGGWGPPRPPT